MKTMIALDFPDVESPMPTNTIKYGDFGEAGKEVAEATGAEKYNIEFVWEEVYKMPGVVNEDGTEITMWEDVSKVISTMKWLTPEKVEEMKEARDDMDAPSCPHITPRPEKKGKVYWISGPPGAGKSTTCQLMGREKGMVYYEADAMLGFINPFVPLDAENPSMAQQHQKGLKGISREDFEIIMGAQKMLNDVFSKGMVDTFDESMQPLLKLMSREILKQKKRLGGDFAVAHAVVSRKSRDLCRSILGPDAVFIVLNLTKSCVLKRLQGRHGESENAEKFSESLHKLYDKYEPAGEDEEGAINITVDENMSTDDVLKLVLEKIG